MSDGITVVTPSLNQAEFVGACLESVRRQHYRNVEHLVIDGGSDDETREVVESFEHATFVDLPDSSQSGALNWGFSNARYPTICWLNADDILLDRAFATVEQRKRGLSRRWFLFSSFVEIDAQAVVKRVRLIPHYLEHAVRNFATYIPTSGSFFSRTVVDDGLLLDGELHYLMDRDFVIRLSSAGYDVVRCPRLLAGFRVHDSQKSGKGSNEEHRRAERARLNQEHGGVWIGGSRVVEHNRLLHSAFKLYVGASWKIGNLAGGLPLPAVEQAMREAQEWTKGLHAREGQ